MNRDMEIKYLETWQQYYRKIIKFCKYQLNEYPSLVEDCCQEVFSSYLEALLKNVEIKNTNAWLYKTASNIAIRFRNKAKNEIAAIDDPDYSTSDAMHVEYDFIEEIMKRNHSDEELLQMIRDSLTDEEKIIFTNCFIEQKPMDSVAKELKITTNYLYKKKWSLKHKLEEKVREILENDRNTIIS